MYRSANFNSLSGAQLIGTASLPASDTADLALGRPLPHLSMGMSNDFDIAIEEGATMVRLGTVLFGGTRG